MTMSYQDDVTLALPMHVRALYIPDLGDKMVQAGCNLLGALSLLTSITPYIPSSFMIQAMLSPQRPDLVSQLAVI
jgi:hypothetical protein